MIFRFRSKTFHLFSLRGNKTLTSDVYTSDKYKINQNEHLKNSLEMNTVNETRNDSETEKNPYYIEHNLRKVYPYYFEHLTYCKKRWLKRTLIDIYSSEIGLYPRSELEKKILSGAVKVNGKPVELHYRLKMSDVLTSSAHRHELPVLAAPLKVLFEDDKLLVIDKPPSIPVHPCGLYRYNSALFILKYQGNREELHTIHRIDRLTSGILIFAKDVKSSREIHEDLDTLTITKEYVCRVEGEFPDGVIMCNKPLKQFYNKMGVVLVHPTGKISITEFQKLSFNGKSSVVKCKLHTGRTHQIRAHLQYLGYPILNDSLYNSHIFGPEKGKHGKINKSIGMLLKDLVEAHSNEWFVKDNEESLSCNSVTDSHITKLLFDNDCYCINKELMSELYKKDLSRFHYDENCFFCSKILRDPKPSELFMFLHAIHYECDKWKFQTDMPLWASENWDVM